jgi:zinc protease
VTLADLTARLERVFAGWTPGDIPAKNIGTVEPPKGVQLYLLDRSGAEQSIILVGTVVTPKANPDEYAFMTFNQVFGGAFTSRINMNLREDKHWSYGAGSVAVDARGQRPWIMFAPVQTDKTKESVQEMLKELRGVTADRPITSEELDQAKDRMTRTLAGRWETGTAVARAIQEIVAYDLPEDYYRTYAQKVRGVTAESVKATTSRLILPDRLVIVVVGDRARVEPGIRELGLGEPRLLDGDGRPAAPQTQ